MVAKAIATECQAGFLSCCGSELVEVYVGRGAARIRNLFQTAREKTKQGRLLSSLFSIC